MRNTITSWDGMRIFRMAVGVALIIQAIVVQDILIGLAGGLFAFMALTNTGCCGAGACSTGRRSGKKSDSAEEVSYEELK